MRATLAVRGGIDVEPYLGSRSTFTLGAYGGVEGRPLAPGDSLLIGDLVDGDPAPLPHLTAPHDQAEGGLDITMDAYILTVKMRGEGAKPFRLSRGSFTQVYWTVAQMVAHHTSSGCNLEIGDLMGSGTVSGPEPGTWASLLELSKGGREPIALPNGEARRFLEDGDEIIFCAHCERAGFVRVGFGECRAIVEPAMDG